MINVWCMGQSNFEIVLSKSNVQVRWRVLELMSPFNYTTEDEEKEFMELQHWCLISYMEQSTYEKV